MTPEETAAMMAALMGPQISQPTDKYGNPEPIEPSDQKSQLDVMYKIVQALTDPESASLFLGGNQSTEPIVEQEEVQLPGRSTLEKWLRMPYGTVENALATEYEANGGSMNAAYATVENILMNPEGNEEVEQLRQQMLSEVGTQYETYLNQSVPVGPDLKSVRKMADNLESQLLSDPTYNYTEPVVDNQGNVVGTRYFNRTESPSPEQEMNESLGLPDAGMQYQPSDFLDPSLNADAAMLREGLYEEPGGNELGRLRDVSEQRRAAERRAMQTSQLGTPDTGVGPAANSTFRVGSMPGPDSQSIAAKLDRTIGDPIENFFKGRSLTTGRIGAGEEGAKIPYPAFANPAGTTGTLGQMVSATSGREQPSPFANYTSMAEQIAAGLPTSNVRRGAQTTASRLRNKQDMVERQQNAMRKRVYSGQGLNDRVDARVAAHRAQKQGRTPRQDELDRRMALLRQYGIGI